MAIVRDWDDRTSCPTTTAQFSSAHVDLFPRYALLHCAVTQIELEGNGMACLSVNASSVSDGAH